VKIFVDMDNVLVDFPSGVDKLDPDVKAASYSACVTSLAQKPSGTVGVST